MKLLVEGKANNSDMQCLTFHSSDKLVKKALKQRGYKAVRAAQEISPTAQECCNPQQVEAGEGRSLTPVKKCQQKSIRSKYR